MPETNAQTVPPGSDVHHPLPPGYYPYPYPPYLPQEQPPRDVVGSTLRETGGLVKTLGGVPPSVLAMIALVGMSGVLLYGFVFVVPQLQKELTSELNRSNEDQRELDRAMYREEGERNRKAAKERETKLSEGIARIEAAVSKWEKK